MIDQSKTYRSSDPTDHRPIRVYATDGELGCEVHGAIFDHGRWKLATWPKDTTKLIESDPHGILPRHRELLAEAMVEHKHDFGEWVEIVRTGTFTSLNPSQHVALIALARLESSLRSEVGE